MSETLEHIAAVLSQRGLLKDQTLPGHQEVTGLTFNSRDVQEGQIFFCKGKAFKEAYLREALERGACAYISEQTYSVEAPALIVKDIRLAMSVVADFFYKKPYQAFHLTGITGTKGKTTTTGYLQSIFQEVEGNRSAYLSSSHFDDGLEAGASHMTTPEALELFRRLDHARESGCQYFTMEVSSQALKYGRVAEVEFEVGAFLNISPDHISPVEHPNFEDYFQSKLKLFQHSKVAVLNKDSDHFDRILQAAQSSETVEKILTVSMKDESADYYACEVESKPEGEHFTLKTADFTGRVVMAMPGIFNIENALVAIAIARYYGVSYADILKGLTRCKAQGRMEIYHSKRYPIQVVVDFAHNKLSFEKLFQAAREMYPKAKVTIVFGAPGNKAESRRKDLGQVAGKWADHIIVTMDDPGTEDPQKISEEILVAIHEQKATAQVVIDRPKAIALAFDQAVESQEETVILLAGKGDEDTMKLDGKDCPYATDTYYALKKLEELDR